MCVAPCLHSALMRFPLPTTEIWTLCASLFAQTLVPSTFFQVLPFPSPALVSSAEGVQTGSPSKVPRWVWRGKPRAVTVAKLFILPDWFPAPTWSKEGPNTMSHNGSGVGCVGMPSFASFSLPPTGFQRQNGPERTPKQGPTMGLEMGSRVASFALLPILQHWFPTPKRPEKVQTQGPTMGLERKGI